ncbi:hypothetical protein CsSME_00032626 [Camellia sinensis var. sinensis]
MAEEEVILVSLPHRVVFLFMIVIACIAEKRDIYLVLMEGDPVAFYQVKFLRLMQSTWWSHMINSYKGL